MKKFKMNYQKGKFSNYKLNLNAIWIKIYGENKLFDSTFSFCFGVFPFAGGVQTETAMKKTLFSQEKRTSGSTYSLINRKVIGNWQPYGLTSLPPCRRFALWANGGGGENSTSFFLSSRREKRKTFEKIFFPPKRGGKNLSLSNSRLDPNLIAGFVNTDGSFSVAFTIRTKGKLKKLMIQTCPVLSISQNTDNQLDKDVLICLKEYFEVGNIWFDPISITGRSNFWISSIEVIEKKIIPFFEKYPLIGQKRKDFLIFKEIMKKIKNKEHFKKNRQGLFEIMWLSKILHPETRNLNHIDKIIYQWFDPEEISKFSIKTTNKYAKFIKSNLENSTFSSEDVSLLLSSMVQPKELTPSSLREGAYNPLVGGKKMTITSHYSPFFITGLVLGDGSFGVSFTLDKSVLINFSMIQHKNSKIILVLIQKFFRISSPIWGDENTNEILSLSTSNSKIIKENIIPHFDRYPLIGRKLHHYQIWRKVFFLKQVDVPSELQHKNENFNKIVDLAYNMNMEGKRRKYSKEEYLRLIRAS